MDADRTCGHRAQGRPAQLCVLHRAAGRPQRPPVLSAARPRTWRQFVDQRHGLYPRPPQRLRRMGEPRLHGLGLRRRAALLPPQRTQPAQRRTHGQPSGTAASGPLHVSDLRTPNPFSQRFVQAAMQAGLPLNHRLQRRGAGRRRPLSGDATQWRALECRPCVSASRQCERSRALNGGRNGLDRADRHPGVAPRHSRANARPASSVMRAGVAQTLRARREVIVSGGAFNSPQLLMASGIGPAAHLREPSASTVVHDLPGVGENLQDHLDVIVNKQVQSLDLYGYSARGFAAARRRNLALPARSYRHGQLQFRRGGRVCEEPSRPGDARRATRVRPRAAGQSQHGAAPQARSWLLVPRVHPAAAEPRSRAAALARTCATHR